MTDYENKQDRNQSRFGKLSVFRTDDGSFSMRSSLFNENFHSKSGAMKEAEDKFMGPIQISQFKSRDYISVLDVCVGMGYNSGCLFEALKDAGKKIVWWGLEIDKRPISIATRNRDYLSKWSPRVQEILKSISQKGSWYDNDSMGRILWGDARNTLRQLPRSVEFDLIFLDAFSPSKCPILWSEEFLRELSMKIRSGGQLQTYSSAAAIRASLLRAGLELHSIKPDVSDKQKWSMGTIAKVPPSNLCNYQHDFLTKNLSMMEREHLLTKAAIPYRDPLMNRSNDDILSRRKQEQKDCKLEITNHWKRRWQNVQESLCTKSNKR